jgi:DNA repair protein RecN (Recombination protein N)
MIDELIVRNLGLIEEAHVLPGPKLTVITGETGTGKTLLLGALRLLLGETSKPDLVGPFGDEATVDGRFITSAGTEIAASRRMPRTGRSRAYLDGTVASAAALDEATTGMVEIIGQHDQLSLMRPSEARRLVDAVLDGEGLAALAEYRSLWEQLGDLLSRQEQLGGDRRSLERERDLADHQATEIAGSGFSLGDDVELERSLARLRNAAELTEFLATAQRVIDQTRETFDEAVVAVRRAARLDDGLERLTDGLALIEQSLGDVAIDVGEEIDQLDGDPASLEEAEARFAALSDLKRKYGSTLEEVLEFGRRMSEDARTLSDLLDSADRISGEIDAAERKLVEIAGRLTAARRRAGDVVAEVALGHLGDLGFREPILDVRIEPAEPGASGADRVSLQFASDRRLKPGDLARVASGGELSRLVLALRLAGGPGQVEALVFDEVDSGIGGATAVEVGRKLAALATRHQVLCVTHLPQVAAFADVHYVVTRSDHAASVQRVEGEKRVEELSRMLAGTADSEHTKRAAADLLDMASEA